MNDTFAPTSRYLSVEEFSDVFDSAWQSLRERFCKYEALQAYDEGEDGPYSLYLAGDCKAFAESLLASREEDNEFVASATLRGVACRRLHSVRLPLSKYLEFECYSYLLSQAAGEQIALAEESEIAGLPGGSPPDFILFDASVLLIQDYDPHGRLRGAWLCDDSRRIEAAAGFYCSAFERGQPVETFFRGDPRVRSVLQQGAPRWVSGAG